MPLSELSKFIHGFSHEPPWAQQSSLSEADEMEQYANLPLKKLTPIIEKMSKINEPTMSTFYKAPNVENKAFTIIFRLSNLLMTLSGLKALNALNALRAAKPDPAPITNSKRSRTEISTTKQSTRFQPFARYGFTYPRLFVIRPRAITLMINSTRKQRVNPMFK